MAVFFNSNMVVFIVMVASMAFCSSAIKHRVGDADGWGIPRNPNFYAKWASRRIFRVGDSLVFNPPSGINDVIEVSKDDYDNCHTDNYPVSIQRGPVTFNLTRLGGHYYTGSEEGRCTFNQKLAINVVPANTVVTSLGF